MPQFSFWIWTISYFEMTAHTSVDIVSLKFLYILSLFHHKDHLPLFMRPSVVYNLDLIISTVFHCVDQFMLVLQRKHFKPERMNIRETRWY